MLLRLWIKIAITEEVRVLLLLWQVYLLINILFFYNFQCLLFPLPSYIQTPAHDDTMDNDNRAMHVDSDIIWTKERGRNDNL